MWDPSILFLKVGKRNLLKEHKGQYPCCSHLSNVILNKNKVSKYIEIFTTSMNFTIDIMHDILKVHGGISKMAIFGE